MTTSEYKKVLKLMDEFKSIETWNKTKRGIIEEVRKIMESGMHLYFISNGSVHGFYVGTFYVENDTHKRKGNLMKYRGKKIMVICVGGGSWNVRQYLVATIE